VLRRASFMDLKQQPVSSNLIVPSRQATPLKTLGIQEFRHFDDTYYRALIETRDSKGEL
jgi:hypothetical protein